MKRRAFSLIELLVVIGILVVLLSILIPAINRSRKASRSVACASNMRQLMMAMHNFAVDHEEHLTGGYSDFNNPDPEKRDWLLGSQISNWKAGPQAGTLWRYTQNTNMYLCPALESERSPNTPTGPGFLSNGHYDYAFFTPFAGANINTIKPESRLRVRTGNGSYFEVHRTPIVCEEQPKYINGSNTEGGHGNDDAIAHNHPGGGWIGCIDGSAELVDEPKSVGGMVGAHLWESQAPSGKMASLGNYTTVTWGYWTRQ